MNTSLNFIQNTKNSQDIFVLLTYIAINDPVVGTMDGLNV